jgi:hypothetical protein
MGDGSWGSPNPDSPGTSDALSYLEVTGDDTFTYKVDNVTLVQEQDAILTGVLRTGIGGNAGGADRQEWDDFEAGDVGTPPPAPAGRSQAVIIA